MVRLLNLDNVDIIARGVTAFFSLQQHFTRIANINHPNVKNCLYALWHNHQCCVYGFPDKPNTNVMVSRSKDGEVVARAIHDAFGFKIVRGSKDRKGAVEATKQMIEALKHGDSGAIMVDGPRGPQYVVKDGVIKIAKLSGVPIVPVAWYSTNFNLIKLPSWDRLEMPVGDVRLVNLYGEPIYVPADGDDENDEKIRLELEAKLEELDEQIVDVYEKVYWHGLWRRKQK